MVYGGFKSPNGTTLNPGRVKKLHVEVYWTIPDYKT